MRMFSTVMAMAGTMALSGVVLAARPDGSRYPALAQAWELLQKGRIHLQSAEKAQLKQGTLGGHSTNAVSAVNVVQSEIELAAEFAEQNRRPGRPGLVRPKPPLAARPGEAKYAGFGDARLEIEGALRQIDDAMQFYAPIGTLGGHGVKALEAGRRALSEINEAERWADHLAVSATVAAPISTHPAPSAGRAQPATTTEGTPAKAPDVRPVVVAQATSLHAVSGLEGEKATPPSNWISQLPTVDQVSKAIPNGKDANETAIRRSAAFEVLEDLIKLFTGKSVGELSQMPLAVEARYREYDKADNFYPKKDVWTLSGTKEFREEVLNRTMSPASRQAYWQVRTGTMAAWDARRAAGANLVAKQTAILDHLPDAATVKRDMKGEGARDTAARTYAAFHWLVMISQSLYDGRSKAGDYADEAQATLRRYAAECASKPECDPALGVVNKIYICRSAYENAPTFVRAVLDKYVAADLQMAIHLDDGGAGWEGAAAIPTGKAGGLSPPTPACTIDGPYSWADEQERTKVGASRGAEVGTHVEGSPKPEVTPSPTIPKDINAKQRKVDLSGTWTGIFSCTSGLAPRLFRITVRGRRMTAEFPKGQECFKGKVFDIDLPKEVIVETDLPINLKISATAKGGPSDSTLTVELPDKLVISTAHYPYMRGDRRRIAQQMLEEEAENVRIRTDEEEQHRRAATYQNLMNTPYMKGSWGH